MTSTAIVIAIGNSDNRLTQREWHEFWSEFHTEIQYYGQFAGIDMHGTWMSDPVSPYQNAAWSLSWDDSLIHLSRDLQNLLREILPKYRQESMAWTVGRTELVPGRDPAPERAILPGHWSCGCSSRDCHLEWGARPSASLERGRHIIELECLRHGLKATTETEAITAEDVEAARAETVRALDLAHQEQCR